MNHALFLFSSISFFVKVRQDCKCTDQTQPSKVKQFLSTADINQQIINFHKCNIHHEQILQETFGSSAVRKTCWRPF